MRKLMNPRVKEMIAKMTDQGLTCREANEKLKIMGLTRADGQMFDANYVSTLMSAYKRSKRLEKAISKRFVSKRQVSTSTSPTEHVSFCQEILNKRFLTTTQKYKILNVICG